MRCQKTRFLDSTKPIVYFPCWVYSLPILSERTLLKIIIHNKEDSNKLGLSASVGSLEPALHSTMQTRFAYKK